MIKQLRISGIRNTKTLCLNSIQNQAHLSLLGKSTRKQKKAQEEIDKPRLVYSDQLLKYEDRCQEREELIREAIPWIEQYYTGYDSTKEWLEKANKYKSEKMEGMK